MSLRIAFDMDGTLADFDGALAVIADRLFPGRQRPGFARRRPPVSAGAERDDPENAPTDPPETAPTDPPGAEREVESALSSVWLSSRQQQAVWHAARETDNFWETLREIEPGSVRHLAALALEHRWEVIFLTQRPETAGDTAQLQTQRWLKRHGFALPSVFVVPGGSRGRTAGALDLHIVVDDRPENCLDVNVESKARAILIWRKGEATPANARRLGIGVVPSMAECLEVMQEITALHEAAPSMLDRLKKRLGLGA
jgi:hypothetical protein